MPDKTALLETIRSPVDGTEAVRLSTPGFDWHTTTGAMFQDLFSLYGAVSDGNKGDVIVAGGVWTVNPNTITNAKLADMPTANFKARITAGTGDPEDITGTQATTLLNVFTSTLKGLAPLSGGGTTNFLRADGSWATPPGGGGATLTVGTTPIVSGTSLRVLYDNAGLLGEYTNTQLTAILDQFTTSLKGVVPGSGGGTVNFLRADGTWATPPGGGLTVGSTSISGGTSLRVLYDNAGVLGEYTNTQLTATLDQFTTSLKGVVPGSGGGTTNFLRADGTWATPSGGGGGTPGGANTQVQFNNAGAFGGAADFVWVSPTLTLGLAATSTGKLALKGTTSGTVGVTTKAAAGTWDLTLPDTAGSSGQVLSTNGAGVTSWIPAGGAASLTVGSSPIASGTNQRLLYDNAGVLGETDILFSASNTFSTPGTELILQQTGDTFGTTRIRLQNRTGLNGALFENASLDLVDFGLVTSTGKQGNYRFEHRVANIIDSPNVSDGELQQIINANVVAAYGSQNIVFRPLNDVILSPQGHHVVIRDTTADLADLLFRPSSNTDGHIRLERRGGSLFYGGNSGEYQISVNFGSAVDLVIGNAVHAFRVGGTTKLDYGSANASKWTFSAPLCLNNAYVNTPITPTGYITICDSTGTTYKIAVSL